MTARNTLRRGLHAAAAIGAALALTFTVAPGAAADPIIGDALPDGSETATLEIRKHRSPATDLPANGTQQNINTTTNPPIADVEFTIRRVESVTIPANTAPNTTNAPRVVQLDMTTREGWEAANWLMRSGTFPWSAGVDEAYDVTDAAGAITFDNLPLGLWMVQETDTPENVVPAEPFFVTLPMTHPTERDNWMYTVWVYPKNAVLNFEKSVVDAPNWTVGQNVVWTLLADVPTLGGTYRIDRFTVIDTLDTRLTPVTTAPGTPGAPVVRLINADPDAVLPTITAGALNHFTVNFETDTREWIVDFTPLGLAYLGGRDAVPAVGETAAIEGRDPVPAGTRVEIIFTTTINNTFGTGTSAGVIENNARFYPNNRSYLENSPIRDTAETRYGGITIVKIEAGTGNPDAEPPVAPTRLAGAQFMVFLTLEDALAQVDAVTVIGAAGTGITQTPEGTVWTTQANGEVRIDGLRASNWANGAQLVCTEAMRNPAGGGEPLCLVDRDLWQAYYLVEIVAPVGMELLAEPIRFFAEVNTRDVAADPNAEPPTPAHTVIYRLQDQTVTNVPHNAGFRLPGAGGIGTTILMYGGIALALAGLAYGIVTRRRTHAAA